MEIEQERVCQVPHLIEAPRRDASLVHFTIGGPWFDEYRDSEYAPDWFAEKDRMLAASRREKVAAAS